MGLAYAEIELDNPRRADVRPIRLTALADSGSMMMCLPEPLVRALDLEIADHRPVIPADGSRVLVPYAGPIRVRFGSRACFVGAYVMGNEVILGAVAMEDMDLIISPSTHEVSENPGVSPHRI